MSAVLMSTVLRFITNLPLWLAALALFFMMCLTAADVTLRSVMNSPIPGASEITEIVLAAVVFLSLPATSFYGKHISVDLLDSFFSKWFLTLRDAMFQISIGGLLFWPAAKIWTSGQRLLSYNEVTLYLGVPTGSIFLCLSVMMYFGAFAMILRGLFLLVAPEPLAKMSLSNS